MTHPTFGHGKICYIVIPAIDIDKSAEFYREVFAWNVRRGTDGSASFDDGVGEVSGMWTPGPRHMDSTGLMIHIMVLDAAATVEEITAHGGEIVQPIVPGAREITAVFRDPGGNLFGIYQHGRS